MSLWTEFLADESGAVLSAEAVLVGGVGVAGATMGLSATGEALNEELKETACAIRSLDQSYSFDGQRTGTAWTAGSSYRQRPVEESLAELQTRWSTPDSEPSRDRESSPQASLPQ